MQQQPHMVLVSFFFIVIKESGIWNHALLFVIKIFEWIPIFYRNFLKHNKMLNLLDTNIRFFTLCLKRMLAVGALIERKRLDNSWSLNSISYNCKNSSAKIDICVLTHYSKYLLSTDPLKLKSFMIVWIVSRLSLTVLTVIP